MIRIGIVYQNILVGVVQEGDGPDVGLWYLYGRTIQQATTHVVHIELEVERRSGFIQAVLRTGDTYGDDVADFANGRGLLQQYSFRLVALEPRHLKVFT